MLACFLIMFATCSYASDANIENKNSGSSNYMMEEIEQIIYGYVNKGGLIERLGRAESDLFGRSLPGTIAERHAAILNFLDVGTEEQPSMTFKLGVAEWIVNKRIDATASVMTRLEGLETMLTGAANQGQPVAMRIESLLTVLVSEPVGFKNVKLHSGTVMRFRFMDELSPAKSQIGDKVKLELTNDLIVNKCLVAPAGSLLLTEVRDVKRPRAFGIPGEVRLSFSELKALGPQRPTVAIGKEAETAIKNARKLGDKGEGAIVSAGAASVAGAVLLGPVGLVSGFFIRGNSIKIAAGSLTYVQISPDIVVSAYPIPASLINDLPEAVVSDENEDEYEDYDTQSVMPENNNDSVAQKINQAKQDTQKKVQQTKQQVQKTRQNIQNQYDSDRDTIIKQDVFKRSQFDNVETPTNNSNNKGTVDDFDNIDWDFELPPEQQVN